MGKATVKFNIAFIKRLWLYFRLGHSTYLAFAMSFVNFVLIFYRLFVEYVQVLSVVFKQLWMFVLVFALVYPPVAVLVGYWHKRTQWSVESGIALEENPYFTQLMPKEIVLYQTLYELCKIQGFEASKLKTLIEETRIRSRRTPS